MLYSSSAPAAILDGICLSEAPPESLLPEPPPLERTVSGGVAAGFAVLERSWRYTYPKSSQGLHHSFLFTSACLTTMCHCTHSTHLCNQKEHTNQGARAALDRVYVQVVVVLSLLFVTKRRDG